MKIALRQLFNYCESHTTLADSLLYDLERETHLKTLAPQMSSGALQGMLLRLLCQLQQSRQVLEIGTFTGYAAISMALGMPEGSCLHTIEVNEELEYLIRKYIRRAKLEERIQLHIGDAREIIPTISGSFDMVFIDAGKKDNVYYYNLIMDRVNPGGLILVDNVLWDGKVLQSSKDEDTRSIRAFNDMIHQDERVENILLPIRDGLMIARKR